MGKLLQLDTSILGQVAAGELATRRGPRPAPARRRGHGPRVPPARRVGRRRPAARASGSARVRGVGRRARRPRGPRLPPRGASPVASRSGRRRLRYLPTPRRGGHPPDQRGSPRAAVGRPRRPRPRYDGTQGKVTGTSFRSGRRTPRVRVKGDFNSWDGREHPMRQLARRDLGALRARRRLRHPVQVRDPRRGRPVAREGRPDGLPHRDPAGDVVGGLRLAVRVEDADWMRRRARAATSTKPMSVYEMHSARGGAGCPTPSSPTSWCRTCRTLVHPRGVPAGDGAPVRRLVGLPGDVVLRAHRPFAAPTSSATSSTGCTRAGSA